MDAIIGISGSLRRDSINTGLLRAAAELMPADTSLEIAGISEIPLYSGDIEASHGIPAPVEHLKGRIVVGAGLLMVTPEYNNSVPGVLKNAVDWLSRPTSDIARVFRDRPVAVIGASPGSFGTVLAQGAWLPVIRHLGMRPWFGGRLALPRAGALFDAHGQLVDAHIRAELRAFIHGFVAFALSARGARHRATATHP
jgi:NAD(P)H-dependent FMN reductase